MKYYFKTDDTYLSYLSNKDPVLKNLIDKIGNYELILNDNYYVKLISSIIGQQLSPKAAKAIFTRVKTLCEEVTPCNMISINDEALRNVGVSRPKIKYIKILSEEIISNKIDFSELQDLTDGEVVSKLTKFKGIGQWTAEMFLIFSLGRLDVFSKGDVGLKRAIMWLYDLNESNYKAKIEHISNNWIPYRSIASLYLWESVNVGLVYKSKNI